MKFIKARVLGYNAEGFGKARVKNLGDFAIQNRTLRKPKVGKERLVFEDVTDGKTPQEKEEVLLSIIQTKKGPRVIMWVFLDEYVQVRKQLRRKLTCD